MIVESPYPSSGDIDMQISSFDGNDDQPIDHDDHANQEETVGPPKKCFSSIQSRKFWASLIPTTCRLCPSMDLVVLGMKTPSPPSSSSSSSSSLSSVRAAAALCLHRTVSWQKLSTLTDFESVVASATTSSTAATTGGGGTAAAASSSSTTTLTHPQQDNGPEQGEEISGVTHVAWSPDGRLLALALPGSKVLLYHVEAMVSSPSSMAGEENPQEGRLCVMSVAGAASASASSTTTAVESHTNNNDGNDTNNNEIVGLTWAHIGRPHPRWSLTDAEQEEDVFWRYRSRYLDRSAALLPPSDYHWQEHRVEGKSAVNTTLPTCRTPLSLLCVSTQGDNGLHLYLHGRYRILTLNTETRTRTRTTATTSVTTTTATTTRTTQQPVVCSPNLTHIWVVQPQQSQEEDETTQSHTNHYCQLLSLYSIPALAQHRYHLQTISSLCCSITCHLDSIRQHAIELVASYKSSLKPLDTKLDGLVRLLKNYGVNQDVRSVLHKYILVGHTASNLSNAMDQFFTSIQMNDQLLQRLERSLQASVANVETSARTGILSPARALAFNVGELHGLARYCSSTSSSLLSESAAHALEEVCSILLVSVEYTVTQLVEARFRLRDLVAWLRSTGSEVKARGTAANSAQRENAKKRRVPQATVQRVLSYLQQQQQKHPDERPTATGRESSSSSSSSITETLLGIPLVELLHESPSFLVSNSFSRASTMLNPANDDSMDTRKTPTVLYATKCAEEAAARVFEHPRKFLSSSVHRMDFMFPPGAGHDETTVTAIHTRVGSDGSDWEDENDFMSNMDMSPREGGFFSPKVVGKSSDDSFQSSSLDCRQWTIIAKSGSSSTHSCCNSVYLYVVPLKGKDINNEDPDDVLVDNDDSILSCCGRASFYLVAEMVLPPSCRLLDMLFYGDDGKSSLSSGTDSGTGREGRQALGLLVSCDNTSGGQQQHQQQPAAAAAVSSSSSTDANNEDAASSSIELWLVQYDSVHFKMIVLEQDNYEGEQQQDVVLDHRHVDSQCQVSIRPLLQTQDYEEVIDEDDEVVYAKTRHITSASQDHRFSSSSRLMLSGSRGIGGVFTTTMHGLTTLDLFDLEEDEEDAEDSESQSMEG